MRPGSLGIYLGDFTRELRSGTLNLIVVPVPT